MLGDCSGDYDSFALGDVPETRAAGLGAAVSYAAVSEPGRWTAEWRIPLKALYLDPKDSPWCCFNIAVHKPGTRPTKKGGKVKSAEQWSRWVADPGAPAWHVWNAGKLQLKRP